MIDDRQWHLSIGRGGTRNLAAEPRLRTGGCRQRLAQSLHPAARRTRQDMAISPCHSLLTTPATPATLAPPATPLSRKSRRACRLSRAMHPFHCVVQLTVSLLRMEQRAPGTALHTAHTAHTALPALTTHSSPSDAHCSALP
jgi:hypothetical protein